MKKVGVEAFDRPHDHTTTRAHVDPRRVEDLLTTLKSIGFPLSVRPYRHWNNRNNGKDASRSSGKGTRVLCHVRTACIYTLEASPQLSGKE